MSTKNVMFVDDSKDRQHLIGKFSPEVLGSFQHLRFKSNADYAAAEKYLLDQGYKKGSHFGQSDGQWNSDTYESVSMKRLQELLQIRALDEARSQKKKLWTILLHPEDGAPGAKPYPKAQVNKLVKYLSRKGVVNVLQNDAKNLKLHVAFNDDSWTEDRVWDMIQSADLDDALSWGGSVRAAKKLAEDFNEGLTSESRSFREEPIPPFAVCYSYDNVVHRDDVYMGSRAECLEYMRTHKPKKPYNFDLMDTDSGRLVSFSLKESKVIDDAYYIVEPDDMDVKANRKSRNYVDLYTEKSFSSVEAANRFIEREISELDDTEEGDEAADHLKDCMVMSGASLKRQYPKLFEAGRTFTIRNDAIKPRGAPEDKARAFDKVNPKTGARPNRSVLKKMQKDAEDFFAIQGEEGDEFTMCLVMSAANSEKSNYYGVNVLLYPDGKTDASTADSFADKEWKNHRGRIVKVAREFLKKANAFSRDIDGPSDYHGYHDKKTNESVEEKKPRWIVNVKRSDGQVEEKKVRASSIESIKKHYGEDFVSAEPAEEDIDESVKAKKTPRPTFKFAACSYEQFERLCPDSESYDETEIDGKSVMAAYDGKNCIGMWYRRAKVGSFCKEFVGDELSYSEEDPNWPYGD